jgi:hypothetical protein
MQLIRENPDVPAAVHISHDGLQAHVSEVELSCWCAEAAHIGKVYEGFCRQRMPAAVSL